MQGTPRYQYGMPPQHGLYDPAFERDSCGIGAIVNVNAERSHSIVEQGREILINLLHRGATGGDERTGDGAGILIEIPDAFYRALTPDLGFELPQAGEYGTGIVFEPRDPQLAKAGEDIVADSLAHVGLELLGWRDVPVQSDVVGDIARAGEPIMRQVFVGGRGAADETLERLLYRARKRIERLIHQRKIGAPGEFYICSLSCHTIVYKGMFIAPQLFLYFDDLRDERVATALAIVHQRYSTNTLPTWHLAQPFRILAHNGEINTVDGNRSMIRSIERYLHSDSLGGSLEDLVPIIPTGGSDSANFDNVLELLRRAGRTLPHSMMMMIPEAFGYAYHMSTAKRAFYEYHAAIMEPWDGPAAMVFTDGRYVGGTLDRNGLRPARYVVTNDGLVVLASEVGVIDFPPERIREKGRLKPGRMFLVDLKHRRIISDNEIKSTISRRKPYLRWLEQNRIELRGLFNASNRVKSDSETIAMRLRAFGYSREDLSMILQPMAANGQEPVGSMGTDTPLAVLSKRPKLLFQYFKQRFAQVTNPAIDPLREGLVMSLMTFIGRERNLLDESPEHCRQLKLAHPILTNEDIVRLRANEHPDLAVATVDATWVPDAEDLAGSLQRGIDALVQASVTALQNGAVLLIISDRQADVTRAGIPILLATAAVHQGLIHRGLRSQAGLIIETGEAREVMHFCLLCGFGASAINPYLAMEAIDELKRAGDLPDELSVDEGIDHYVTAIKKGILKTMSKMGISTLRSYRHAGLFEAVGLDQQLIGQYFPNTPSRIGGCGLQEVAQEAYLRHEAAHQPRTAGALELDFEGEYHYRIDGEHHEWNPETIHLLQHAVRKDDYGAFERYAAIVNEHSAKKPNLRGLFSFVPGEPVALDEVEPVEAIVKRFNTGAMSHGSISKEAHETLAIAMNRLGAKSNTGEGGEDPYRYQPMPNGDSKNSRIKQVASARFGVTINYLSNAEEIQIKVAQGAKPGEGGQLPGHKVTEEIARLRYSTPGVSLISPPPHHDIYSIEDLAQLIYDLKCACPGAKVSVKLVAEVGVGTVAAGVSKANADEVLISGHDGGTGASPLSSIKNAGIPWELGLAETQQVLVQNSLRDRIRVQTDGQIKTGRDIVVAALLGAEQFGFGTSALVAEGCIMMRKCHLGTCPVGIATQDPELRKRFAGEPEHVERYMYFLAMQVRELMAELGFRTMDEMIGQVERLKFDTAIEHWKAKGLDLSPVLTPPAAEANAPRRCLVEQRDCIKDALDWELWDEIKPLIESEQKALIERPIRNVHRTVGAILSNRIVTSFGPDGLSDNSVEITFNGSAGQSFGAFLAPGVTMRLVGDANDYLGKGLSGGRIVVKTPPGSPFEPHENVIVGNTLLYGATSGEVFINGLAGERFAVRNSGATAVVEGVGDHGCEYMTGGLVIVLGQTGRNFAAGMSGGIAYVLDEHQWFDTLCNLDMVDLEHVYNQADRDLLHAMITLHVKWTGSSRGQALLDDWAAMVGKFVKVMPIDYRKALERMREEETVEADRVLMTEEVYGG
jgi:glutamate synthase (NADPH/NADH) large chain